MKKSVITAVVLVFAASAGGWYWWQQKSADASKQVRSPVQVVRSGLAQKKSLPVVVQANGTVTPFSIVEVRPQTQNIVREVHVKEGQDVKAGQLLFTLDQRMDVSNVERARAQVERDRADLAEAHANLKRSQELLASKFVSKAAVDTAQARVDALLGTLKADIAATQSSNVTLSNNKISASISGRIGIITVFPGSLAQPTGTPMLTIAQIEPVAVSFSVPENELQYIRATYPQGDAPVMADVGDLKVQGKLYFIDNTADIQTGTIKMKARFENADRKLWPGTYLNVSLVTRTITDAVVVPPQAVVTGPVDKLVYVVQPDSTVKAQKVEVVSIDDGQAAIRGIAPGTRVVLEGAQNLRSNVKVREAPESNDGKGGKADKGEKGGKGSGSSNGSSNGSSSGNSSGNGSGGSAQVSAATDSRRL